MDVRAAPARSRGLEPVPFDGRERPIGGGRLACYERVPAVDLSPVVRTSG